MVANGRRYEQPYSSRHVLNNTIDPARTDQPAYVRLFPRFLNSLYRKQTPFSLNLLPQQPVAVPAQARSESTKTGSQSVNQNSSQDPKVKSQKSASPVRAHQQAPQVVVPANAAFKTMAPESTKKTATLSNMPSDFEHIFHYSEHE